MRPPVTGLIKQETYVHLNDRNAFYNIYLSFKIASRKWGQLVLNEKWQMSALGASWQKSPLNRSVQKVGWQRVGHGAVVLVGQAEVSALDLT